MRTHTIIIPNWHPVKLNKLLGSHWCEAHKMKLATMQMICAYARQQNVTKAKGRREVEIIINIAKSKRGRTPDEDAFYKSTWDALAKGQYVVDDSPAWMSHKPTVINRPMPVSSTIIILTDHGEQP